MNICIISHEYPPNIISGCGTALTTLAAGLTRRGHHITIITPLVRTDVKEENSKNLRIIRIPILQSGFLGKFNLFDNRLAFSLALRKFRNQFDFTKFDILHIYDVHDSYFLDKHILNKIPVIISVNDHYSYITPWNILKFPYATPNLIKRYLHAQLTKLLNSHYLRKAHHIITITNYQRAILSQHCQIPVEKMTTIYRGMDFKRFTQAKNKYHSQKLLYIGSNMERKGVQYLIDAMPAILEKYPQASLTIIGKKNTALTRLFEKKLQAYGIQEKVQMLEYVPSTEIPKYFAEANVFVLPAIIETLAVTVLEALTSKTPVVATKVGGHEEAISKNSGILIQPQSSSEISNAIIEIFSHPKRAEQLGKNAALKIQKQFSKERMVAEVESNYFKLLSVKKS